MADMTMADINDNAGAPGVHPFKDINNKQNAELYKKDFDAQLELCSEFVRLVSLRETRSMNLFTMGDLITTVNENESVTALQAEEEDHKNFMAYQKEFYKPFATNTIKKYHIFSSHKDHKGVIRYYESDLDRQEEKTLLTETARLQSFPPRDENDIKRLEELEKKLKDIKEKTTQYLAKNIGDPNRKAAMTQAPMETLPVPGVRDIKQVEMTKYKKFVPEAFKLNSIYKMPDQAIMKKIKDERNAKVRSRNSKKKKAKTEETKEGGSSKEGEI
jgi:hypothetical protein